MSITTDLVYVANLDRGLAMTAIGPLLADHDQAAHRLVIRCVRQGAVDSLDGYTVVAYMIRQDGTTVVIEGEAQGNALFVTLPAACYAKTGGFSIAVKMTDGADIATVFAGTGSIIRSRTDTIVDPGEVVPDLAELLAAVNRVEKAAEDAEAATAVANEAAQGANSAASAANDAARDAAKATEDAKAATVAAERATDDATVAAQNADRAAQGADTAAQGADTAAHGADVAANNANNAAQSVDIAATSANSAAQSANIAASAATNAANAATSAANVIDSMRAEAVSLPPGSDATATWDRGTGLLRFGIPQSNLTYATFEVDGNMDLLMYTPEGFDGIDFRLQDGELEMII